MTDIATYLAERRARIENVRKAQPSGNWLVALRNDEEHQLAVIEAAAKAVEGLGNDSWSAQGRQNLKVALDALLEEPSHG